MPIPRPRFTVRRLMIAVAVVAVLLGVVVGLKRRSDRFRAIALRYAAKHKEDRMAYDVVADEGRFLRRYDYHLSMQRKYEMATERPWLPVPPDPPEPE